jgi:hypothetical protein
MPFSVYDGIVAYSRAANMGLYLGSRTSIFNDPSRFKYDIKSNRILVRQIDAGAAGTYDPARGWMNGGYGSGRGVEWIPYECPYDRAKTLTVDAVTEAQSYANGMESSINLLFNDFFQNHLPAEIDATNIAQWFSKVPSANVHTNNETDWKTDADHILDTLNNLEMEVFNSGYNGETVIFMRAKIYKNLITALQNHNGFASGAMLLNKPVTITYDTEIDGDAERALTVTIDTERYGKFIIVEMPDDRMFSHVTLLDGVSAGQQQGGYVADNDAAGYSVLDMVVLPLPSAFTSTRYLISNYLIPNMLLNTPAALADLSKANSRMFGNVEVGHAGINQKGDNFEYDIRIMYGGDIFENRRRNCFAVKHTDEQSGGGDNPGGGD